MAGIGIRNVTQTPDKSAQENKTFTAVVIGAGVAGLTVAHELAERRFQVWVVEPTQDVNRFAQKSMAIGGMARTQYVAAKKAEYVKGKKTPAPPLTKARPLSPVVVYSAKDLEPPAQLLREYVYRYLDSDSELELYGPRDLCKQVINTLEGKVRLRTPGEFLEPKFDKDSEKSEKYDKNTDVALVRRPRMMWVDLQPTGRLSPDDMDRVDAFLQNLKPGDKVRLRYKKDQKDDGVSPQERFLRFLRCRHLEVEVGEPLRDDDRIELKTIPKPKNFKLDPKGLLRPEANEKLAEFLGTVATGDVVEIHINNSKALAVDQIKVALKQRDAIGVLAGAEVVCMRSLSTVDSEHVIPGEHGFRFFPAFYRHLRNTLERIPVFEVDRGSNPALLRKLSGRWVIDNLVNTPVQALAGGGTNPAVFPRTPSVSSTALCLQLRDLLFDRGYELRDIHQFMTRVFRYMATGSTRREAELETLSWWEYLRGYDPTSGAYRYRYSEQFEKDIGDSPRILAAFDARWGDARSDGTTFVQLLLTNFLESKAVDQVLNAPTTEAWFEHWEKYLTEFLKVIFVPAKVTELAGEAGTHRRVKPRLESVDPASESVVKRLQDLIDNGKVHYFVMATDAPAAEDLVVGLGKDYPQFRAGIYQELNGFTTALRASPRGNQPTPKRTLRFGDAPWDRFQTLTGIQFYFLNVTGIFNGHVYFMDAPLALSSINQQQFWRFNTIARGAPYQSVLSADIGNFDWNVANDKVVATNVWSQIVDALKDYWRLGENDVSIQRLKEDVGPQWFHLDKNIVLTDASDKPLPLSQRKNLAPYLIPMVDDWRNRPKDTLWDPGGSRSTERLPAPTADLWHAPWGGYRVHWGQWVFTGTYLRHFTRMTTMEAANESGRHAVNAILDHLTYKKSPQSTEAVDAAPSRRRRYHTGGNPLEPHSAYVPTPYGDYCHIWDPEKDELTDLVPLRELDDWLFEQGLPHVLDLIGQEVLPSLMSYLPSAHEMGLPSFNDILRALTPPFTPPPGAEFPWGWKP